MKTYLLSLTAFAALAASPLSMTAAPAAGQSQETATAIPAAISAGLSASPTVLPLELTAIDLVTKVYGVLDTGLSEKDAVKEAGRRFNLTPSADSEGLWLDTADGYVVSYYGMTPLLSAVAHFDENGATDYSYFFQFPYASGSRHTADTAQCAFCGYLLQEMNDIGLMVGVPDTTDSIFEAFGSCDDKYINVRLLEEENIDDSGRFILMLSIVPGAYTSSDEIMAGL